MMDSPYSTEESQNSYAALRWFTVINLFGNVGRSSWSHGIDTGRSIRRLNRFWRYGLAIALVTNFDHHPYVRSLVPRLGTNQYFSSLVISGEVGFDKPDPEIFRIALQELSASAENAVHIGDSEVDVLGAQAAGVTPIQILSSPRSNDISGPEDHEVINSLAEVPGLVRTLLGYRGMLIQFALAQVRIPDRPQPLVAD